MVTELQRQLTQLRQGDHICPIYETFDEQMATAVPFIKLGFARGERCVYVADERSFEQLCAALAAAGVNVQQERDRGALQLVTKRDAFLKSGSFDPAEMIRHMHATEVQALADGFHGLRHVGEMTWALGPEIGNHRLIEFEAVLNGALPGSRTVAVCQYNRQRFSPAVIYDVLRTHPVVIVGYHVYPNPYYEPPDLVLAAESPASDAFKAKRVDSWLAHLRQARAAVQERDRAERQIRFQASLLDQVRSAVIVTDMERTLIYWNRYAEILHQWRAAEVLGRKDVAVNIPEDGEERVRDILLEVERTGHWEGEMNLRRKDGSVFPAQVVVALLRDKQGKPCGYVGVANDITERKHAEAERDRLHREVAANQQLLAVLSRRLIEAQEQERRHLARELHDQLGQVLTSIRLNLEALRPRVDAAGMPRLEESMQVVDQAIEQVRGLSFDLRPAALDLLGLEAALRAFVNRLAARAGLALEFASNLGGHRLPATLETVCFRVVQEAFTNVLRHAHATRCWINLVLRDGEVQITVGDDGRGFDVGDARRRALAGESLGLLSLQERVQLFGGQIAIDAAPGRGTTIRVRFPVHAPEDMDGGG